MFEYKVFTANNAAHLQVGLTSLGIDGWELVGQSVIENRTFGSQIVITLRREKQWEPQKS